MYNMHSENMKSLRGNWLEKVDLTFELLWDPLLTISQNLFF